MILAKIVNVIQHTRSCSSVYWAAICFYFINQPCALYIAFDKCFNNCDVVVETQARNQLMTPGGAKSFLKGAQIFLTVSNSFRLCPTLFSRGGEKFSRGDSRPLRPPNYGPVETSLYITFLIREKSLHSKVMHNET